MKAVLEFNLDEPEDQQAHKRAVKATDAYLALWATGQEIFRPHRKHGYDDSRINAYLGDGEGKEAEAVFEVISLLEERFYEILTKYGINLDEDIS